MNKINVAVVGASGFVGDACCHIFREQNLHKIDPRLGTSVEDIQDKPIDLVMICVPTPMGQDGKINSSIVESVLEKLKHKKDCLLVLKSTVVPEIVAKYESIPNFVYNPEFLTERNARNDAENPTHTVIGSNCISNCKKLKYYYQEHSTCKDSDFIFMSAVEAAFVKYGINSFLMLKVLFFNQYAEQVQKLGGSYENVKLGIGSDPRITLAHMNVPGNDGRMGSSGPCFGKDIPAIIRMSNNELSILREAWNTNCDYRNSYPELLPREIEQHITFNKI
jgi:UDPglucose 6-dehydrogenase